MKSPAAIALAATLVCGCASTPPDSSLTDPSASAQREDRATYVQEIRSPVVRPGTECERRARPGSRITEYVCKTDHERAVERADAVAIFHCINGRPGFVSLRAYDAYGD